METEAESRQIIYSKVRTREEMTEEAVVEVLTRAASEFEGCRG